MMAVSVVIPTHNRPAMLAECVAALEPLLASGEGEVIVVDDRSGAENQRLNREACGQFSGIRYHFQSEGQGAPAARNRGTRLATGKFIWYLDDDDRPGPQTIHDVLSAARTDDGETVIALPMRIMLDGDCFRLIQPTQEGMSFDFVRRHGHQVNTSCAVFSRSLLERVGPWDESLLTGQDTDLFLRVAAAKARCLTPPTEPVRVEWSHPARITRAVWRQQVGRWQFLKKHWGALAPVRRARYLVSLAVFAPAFTFTRYRLANAMHAARRSAAQ
ncbi:MAG: glycosyltransferase [Maioricimonas sp. JB049]